MLKVTATMTSAAAASAAGAAAGTGFPFGTGSACADIKIIFSKKLGTAVIQISLTICRHDTTGMINHYTDDDTANS